MTDLNTRISFYTFDDNESIEKQVYKQHNSAPEAYVLVHESNIAAIHNDIHDNLEAFYLVLEHASQNRCYTRGYYENLELIYKRFVRIGNLLDADLMRELHKRGPGRDVFAVRK